MSKPPFAGPFLQLTMPDAIDAAKYLQRLYGTGSTNDVFQGDQAGKNDLTNAASYGTSFNGNAGSQRNVGAASFDLSLYQLPADVEVAGGEYAAWQQSGQHGGSSHGHDNKKPKS